MKRCLQTCSEEGLHHLAPLVAPVSSDGDNVPLPHLKTGYSKTPLAGSKLFLNSLTTRQQEVILLSTQHYKMQQCHFSI